MLPCGQRWALRLPVQSEGTSVCAGRESPQARCNGMSSATHRGPRRQSKAVGPAGSWTSHVAQAPGHAAVFCFGSATLLRS